MSRVKRYQSTAEGRAKLEQLVGSKMAQEYAKKSGIGIDDSLAALWLDDFWDWVKPK